MRRRPAILRFALFPLVFLAALGSGCTKRADGGQAESAGSPAGGSEIGARGNNLLKASSFDDGKSVPWTTSFTAPADGSANIERGALCVEVKNTGSNPWDAQLSHAGLKLQPGREYAIDYRLWTSAPSDVRVKLGLEAPPYSEYWQQSVEAESFPRRVTQHFTLVEAPPGSLALGFQFAGAYAHKVPLTLCIDEVSVTQTAKR